MMTIILVCFLTLNTLIYCYQYHWAAPPQFLTKHIILKAWGPHSRLASWNEGQSCKQGRAGKVGMDQGNKVSSSQLIEGQSWEPLHPLRKTPESIVRYCKHSLGDPSTHQHMRSICFTFNVITLNRISLPVYTMIHCYHSFIPCSLKIVTLFQDM